MVGFCPKCQEEVELVSEFSGAGESMACPICGTIVCFIPEGTTLREEVILKSKTQWKEIDDLILNGKEAK